MNHDSENNEQNENSGSSDYNENMDWEKDSGKTDASLYQVRLDNDDYTPMAFVVKMLEMLFFMDRRQAVSVMMEAHQTGSVVCGVFARDVAETKVSQLLEFATSHEHPLSCRMEAA